MGWQSVKMAWKAVLSNKMRSFLTMLGISIGVVALIVLVSLVNGTSNSVHEQISSIGTNLLRVSIMDDKEQPLKLADLKKITEENKEIKETAPVAQTSSEASAGSHRLSSEETVTVYGTTGAYEEIMGMELFTGRFLKGTDVDNHTNVAVVNAGFASSILGRMNVVGETIKLDGISFQIIGILQADEHDSSTTENLEVYIPYTSLFRISDSVSAEINFFLTSASSEESLEPAKEKLTEILSNRFAQDEDAFTIINQSSVMKAVEKVNQTMGLMLGGIAGVSLLVGGIGIMNIMLVSVTERTREIGIRKAIGASRRTILLQFLIEALIISMLGCMIGIGLSWAVLQVIPFVADTSQSYPISVRIVWIAVIFSLLIGVIFGIYPASKASAKKPIEALRYIS